MSTALQIDAVSKRFGAFTAVEHLSLSVPRGVIYGVLGPNGAGKTTTMRMVNDIFRPDEGRIRLFDTLAPGKQAARRMGYLPEERGLYQKMSVRETLRFFGELRGLSGRDAQRRGERWLERLGLGAYARHKLQALSKGMQQKVQFVTAVLHEPELLILDEPWSGLDPINADVLREIVLEQKAAGRTILFSTHLMDQAETLCDWVCIIARGRRVLAGELDAVRREAAARGLVALAFVDEGARRNAEPVLSDPRLVASRLEQRSALQVELASGASADALLRALVEAQVSLRRFAHVEPTLHQIFVDRVGAEAQPGAGHA